MIGPYFFENKTRNVIGGRHYVAMCANRYSICYESVRQRPEKYNRELSRPTHGISLNKVKLKFNQRLKYREYT